MFWRGGGYTHGRDAWVQIRSRVIVMRFVELEQAAPWVYATSPFVPCLSSLPPDLIFRLYCSLLVLWAHCCLFQKNHVMSLLFYGELSPEALVEEGGCLPIWYVEISTPHHPENMKACIGETEWANVLWRSRLWALVCFSWRKPGRLKTEMTQGKRVTRACSLFSMSRLACQVYSQLSLAYTREQAVCGQRVSIHLRDGGFVSLPSSAPSWDLAGKCSGRAFWAQNPSRVEQPHKGASYLQARTRPSWPRAVHQPSVNNQWPIQLPASSPSRFKCCLRTGYFY